MNGRPPGGPSLDKPLNVGGQAVIEGVMMRGPKSMVIAVRRPDGSIVVKDDKWIPYIRRFPGFKLPFVRGAVVMIEALINGMQALSFSAAVAIEEEERAARKAERDESEVASVSYLDEAHQNNQTPEVTAETGAMTQGALALSMAFSLVMGVGLFIYLPHWGASVLFNLAGGLSLATEAPVESPVFHTVVGTIKLTIFVAYILLIRQMPDIYRVFQYHGAEHKSIHTYEAGQELTIENARKWPTFHPRCGTSFLVFVILISVFFFAAAFPVLQATAFPSDLSGWRLNLLQASAGSRTALCFASSAFRASWCRRSRPSSPTTISLR